MSHAFTLALVYALVMHATCLLHAAAAGWAAARQLPAPATTVIGAALATAIGMALAAAAVTGGVVRHPAMQVWFDSLGWLGASVVLLLTLLLYEATRAGRLWRAMGANAPGLLAIGVRMGMAVPLGLGLLLALLAGLLAPPPAVVDWLPLAALGLLAMALPDRPRARATLGVLAAWLVGAAIGGLELLLDPAAHAVAVGLMGLLAVRFVAPRLARAATL